MVHALTDTVPPELYSLPGASQLGNIRTDPKWKGQSDLPIETTCDREGDDILCQAERDKRDERHKVCRTMHCEAVK